jgi:hypothetical protein
MTNPERFSPTCEDGEEKVSHRREREVRKVSSRILLSSFEEVSRVVLLTAILKWLQPSCSDYDEANRSMIKRSSGFYEFSFLRIDLRVISLFT